MKSTRPAAVAASLIGALLALPDSAACQHAQHGQHGQHGQHEQHEQHEQHGRHAPPEQHAHGDRAQHAGTAGSTRSTQIGQGAFAALAEVVRLLEADPATDWSRVDLEALRQHLIDMNEIVLHAQVTQVPVPGGLRMDVTGTGRTLAAIRRMVPAHVRQPDLLDGAHITVEDSSGGVRLTALAARADDTRTEARIRGLGFSGLLVLGEHHGPHHVAIARGRHDH